MVALAGYLLLGQPFLLEMDGLVELYRGVCAFFGLHVQNVP